MHSDTCHVPPGRDPKRTNPYPFDADGLVGDDVTGIQDATDSQLMGHVFHDPDAGPCAAIPTEVLHSDLSSKAIRLYARLVFYAADSADGMFPSRPVIAEMLGLQDLWRVTRLVRELDSAGALDTIALTRRPTPDSAPTAGVRRRRADRNIQRAFRRIGERDGFRCRTCGIDRTLTVDHIAAVFNDGDDE